MARDAAASKPHALPAALSAWCADRLEQLQALAAEQGVAFTANAINRARLEQVLLASDFAFDACRRQPHCLSDSGMTRLTAEETIREHAQACLTPDVDEPAFMRQLRQFREIEALRLLWRDVNGLATVEQTLDETTRLYTVLIEYALAWSAAWMQARFGTLRDRADEPVHLIVFALGKLGGGELNFSSDVDLVLAYACEGSSDGRRKLDASEYFARQIRVFVRLLSEPTANGIAARVDLRLRPFGQSGPLAMSFAAMEHYFQSEGRDWERYAWIKARPVAGDRDAGWSFLHDLRPFIYRKYLDFTAFAGLRDMKVKIDAEVRRRDLADNLKLGPGGIREIEFIVQLMQLIRGGRESPLRIQGFLPALLRGNERGYIADAQAHILRYAYLFLRQLENRVQMWRDTQIHTVPSDPQLRTRLALALGYADWPQLAAQLAHYRALVAREFATVLVPHADQPPAQDSPEIRMWQHACDQTLTAEQVTTMGFADAQTLCQQLQQLAHSARGRSMSARGRGRLDRLMPQLLAIATTTPAPTTCLLRLIRLVEAIARRSAYLALLQEQPGARRHVADLFAKSAYLADCVIAQPLLLDDVLEPRMQQLPLTRQSLRSEIQQSMDGQDERGLEEELDHLAELKSSLAFRLALAHLDGHASAAQTTRRLAALADAVVGMVLKLARRELEQRHGRLPGADLGFCIFAYGSLGSQSLGFTSDLDLVFLFDGTRGSCTSDGARPLDGFRWYQRLAQRCVHWLSTITRAGRLYTVDTRLRPDGSKSLLVTSIERFASYQQEQAWIWEHQALLRARMVAGDVQLAQAFHAVRTQVLAQARQTAVVRCEVLDMRQRWRQQRDRSTHDRIDLKQGAGALLDIGFVLEGLVLSHAAAHPELIRDTSNAFWLDKLQQAGILTRQQQQMLWTAHDQLLQLALDCTLDNRPRVVARDPCVQDATQSVLAAAEALGYAFAPMAEQDDQSPSHERHTC